MSFTTKNDINILQASDEAIVGAGQGDDTYIITEATLSAGQKITITDTQGANKLQLVGGLKITSSKVLADAVELTLSNGAVISVDGADKFTFDVGGNVTAGVTGTSVNYATLVTGTLGTTIPTGGTPNNGGAVTIAGGSSGPGGVGQTVALTAGTDSLASKLGTGNDTITGGTGTLGSADTIVDSSTTDADVLTATVPNASLTSTITNIETVNLKGDFLSTGIDLANVTGTKTLNLSTELGFGTGTVTNVAANRVGTITAGNNLTGLSVTASAAGTSGAVTIDPGALTTVTVSGGAGIDTFTVKSAGTLSVTGATNTVETLNLVTGGTAANTLSLGDLLTAGPLGTFAVSGTQSATLSAAAADLTGRTGTKSLDAGKTLAVNIKTAAAAADLSKIAADSWTVVSGSTAVGANDITFAAGTTTLSLKETVITGTGALTASGAGTGDILNLTLDKTQTNLYTKGFETVQITATAAISTTTSEFTPSTNGTTNVTLLGDKSFTLGAAKFGNLNASGLTGTASLSVTTAALAAAGAIVGSKNNDTFDLTNAGQDVTVVAGAGDDIVTLTTGKNNTLVLEDGNDTVNVGNALTNADTLVGGAGTDTLNNVMALSANTLDNVTGFEVINLAQTGAASVTTLDQLVAAGATLTVSSTAAQNLTWNGAAETDGSFVISHSAAGVDIITGGAKADTITTTASSATSVIDGGAGNDAITVTATGLVTIKGGAGDDVINTNGNFAYTVNGGAGADQITIGAAATTVQTLQYTTAGDSPIGAYDTVYGFVANAAGSGGDLLNFASTNVLTGTNLGASVTIATGFITGGVSDLAAFITAFSTSTVQGVIGYTVGSDVYIGYSDGLAATAGDQLVRLVGVTATAISTTQAAATVGIV